MEIAELLRLFQDGASDHTIAKMLHHTRRTVARYRRWAEREDLLTGALPPLGVLHQQVSETLPSPLPPQQTSTVARYADEIVAYRARGMEAAAIRVRLEERHQVPISYAAVWRFLRKQEAATPPEAFVRVETPPGEEAQVDFGYAGLTIDPTTGALRKTWVFVLVLSCSRHLYAELVFDQRVATWLLCHQHAFAAFGGVPARIVPDNLKAAIVRASFTDPVAQRSYRECALHYGFLIDPNPPHTPHLKGKVENGVHYVTRNFLAGRDPAPITELNQGLQRWTAQIAGQRVHGTTRRRPLEQFTAMEQPALRPLPTTPYDPATWQPASVYRDGYVTFERAYYSVPYRLIGQPLWVRGGARTVEVYTEEHALIATHDRAAHPGDRQTHLDHLPPEKVAGVTLTREQCRLQAAAIGPATLALVERLLDHRPEDRLRNAGRVLGLAVRYTPARLETACARADAFGEADYATVKRILHEGLDQQAVPAPAALPCRSAATAAPGTSTTPSYTFVRQASDFVAGMLALAGVR